MPRVASSGVLVRAVLALGAASAACAACSDGGAAPLDGAAAVDAAPVSDAAVPPTCPLLGAYALRSIVCRDGAAWLDLATFVSQAPNSILELDEVGGACQVRVVYQGPACLEEQAWTMTRVPDDPLARWTLTGGGIARCAPTACRFEPDDATCLPGDRAGSATASVAFVLDVGDLVLTLDGPTGVCAARGYPQEEQVWRQAFDPGV